MKATKDWRFGLAGVLLFVGCRFLTSNTFSAGIAALFLGLVLYLVDTD